MPYSGPDDERLPDYVKKLSKCLREIWVKVFNENYDENDEGKAFRIANTAVKKAKKYCEERLRSESMTEGTQMDEVKDRIKFYSSYTQDHNGLLERTDEDMVFKVVACEQGTVATNSAGEQYRYTTKSLEDSVPYWVGKPIVANHEDYKVYGKVLSAQMVGDKLVLDVEITDDKTKSYLKNDNYEGFSIGSTHVKTAPNGDIISFMPAHLSVIYPPREPACDKGVCRLIPKVGSTAVSDAPTEFEKEKYIVDFGSPLFSTKFAYEFGEFDEDNGELLNLIHQSSKDVKDGAINWEKYRKFFLLYDPTDPTNEEKYCYPIGKPTENGIK